LLFSFLESKRRNKMAIVEVTNLATLEKRTYTCSAAEAVIAAYRQELGDWNTWDYPTPDSCRYLMQGDMDNRTIYLCGDWTATEWKEQ
jgi:hypothetical protein